MAIRNTIRTHVVGSDWNFEQDDVFVTIWLIFQILSLVLCWLIYHAWSAKTLVFELAVESKAGKHASKLFRRFLIAIPFMGGSLARVFDRMTMFIKFKALPFMIRVKRVLETLFQLCFVDATFRNKNVRLIFTGGTLEITDPLNLPTTSLIIGNHRSIMDYTLINYLVQGDKCPGVLQYLRNTLNWNVDCFLPKLKFLSWGRLTNMPSIGLLSNILLKDENAAVDSQDLEDFLKKEGNHVLALFPEVNIITSELRLVQRKLARDNYLPLFDGILYPRFKNLTSTVNCFARLQHVERSRKTRYIKKAAIKTSSMVSKVKHPRSRTSAREIAQVNLFLGDDLFANPSATVKAEQKTLKAPISISPFLWDLTIVYYRATYSSGDQHAHVHEQHNLKKLKGEEYHYQLEQITPSFLQLLTCKFRGSPILVRIHVNKHPIFNLMKLSDRKLESWLEKTWLEKDALMQSMQNTVKIN
ncbi:LAME_0H18602g1_1 [Lachancea meyersii CBS 8951]|uniref:LAME_0H18602g1_1 n=1 Tax=Lachancea meyersii CBS 8951 TaxID=1266667 RepID=A0A1G4KJ01_9SACH|nr:LAME_0H18602g1_1 [Lachancea meyersii CBS 8951]